MKGFALAFFLVLGCGKNEEKTSFIHEINTFAKERCFSIEVEDGDKRAKGEPHPVYYGNAFLVDTDLVATAYHVIHDKEIKNPVITVYGPYGHVQASIALADPATDIALLKAPVDGKPLSLRPALADEGIFYVLGQWPFTFFDTTVVATYVHEIVKYVDQSTVPEHKIAFIGKLAPGMSGSPIFGMDGDVVGLLTNVGDPDPVGAAVKSKHILELMRKYKQSH